MLTDDDKALVERPCTCHADDAPSVCQKKYALNECRIEAQAAEIERLREALGWYAEDNHWRYIPAAGCSCVDADGGDVARAALGETE